MASCVCVNSVALPGNNRISRLLQLLNYVEENAVSKRAVTSSIIRKGNNSTENKRTRLRGLKFFSVAFDHCNTEIENLYNLKINDAISLDPGSKVCHAFSIFTKTSTQCAW